MKIFNPATHEMITEIPEDDAAAALQKFKRASAAWPEWAKLSFDQRISIIKKFHDLMQDHQQQLARDLTQEVGKPLPEAINEINGACGRIIFFLEESKKWLMTQETFADGKTTDILGFDPLGVVCNISAWNYPFLVGVNVFIPALIAGNAVLYKPSEYSTLTGLNIERLLHQAGVPQDIFITVVGARATGEALLDLPCHGYFFTGSYKTGNHIAQRVAPKMVPVGLELGGKDPLYVTNDIQSIDAVAAAVSEGCFYNNGQSCCAVERVYVHQDIYEAFMEKFIEHTQALKVGDPLVPGHQQGALTRLEHLDYLEAQIADAIKKGASLSCGGKRLGKNFYAPTILENVNHQMQLMKQETFGPLIGVMKVASDQEAVSLMNDTEYGLTAAVYCRDLERAKMILQQVEVGTAYINCCDRVSPYLPWSGRKHSGLGSTLSYLGILAFARPRAWQVRKS